MRAFVSRVNAAAPGWAWLGFRLVYPWAYRLKFPGVFLSTMPAYVCVAYLLGEVVRCALKMSIEEKRRRRNRTRADARAAPAIAHCP